MRVGGFEAISTALHHCGASLHVHPQPCWWVSASQDSIRSAVTVDPWPGTSCHMNLQLALVSACGSSTVLKDDLTNPHASAKAGFAGLSVLMCLAMTHRPLLLEPHVGRCLFRSLCAGTGTYGARPLKSWFALMWHKPLHELYPSPVSSGQWAMQVKAWLH